MAGYTRQDTANNIANGNVIDADDFDAEYDAIELAFASSGGHTHDGTTGGGSPITKVGPVQDLVISATALTPKTTNTLDLGTATVQFKNAWFDGTVDTDALTVSGSSAIGGNLTVTGTTTLSSTLTASTVDINGGDIDGTTIGSSSHTTGKFTTLQSTGQATLDTVNIDGGAIDSTTIGFTSPSSGAFTTISSSAGITGNVTGTVSDVSNHDTDDITEGATNQYFTTARARNSVSASGSLAYDSTTGAFTYTQADTDTVSEGSTNLYYTTTRATTDAKAAISVTDSGGDGSLAYSNGVITYTGPSAADTRAHFSGGTGVSITDGTVAIGQAVETDSNVTFNDAIISGNLTVSGTTTTVNSNDVNIADATLTLNSDEAGTPSQDAGIVIERGTAANKSFLWDESEDEWTLGSETLVAGTFEGNIKGNVTGNLSFGDNGKAIFGADSDLQIYHDTQSRLVSSGDLLVNIPDNDEFQVLGSQTASIRATATGSVRLFYNGLDKLATTTTGIDVTGTAVTDGVTVAGNILLQTEGNEVQFNTSGSPVNKIYTDDTYTTNGLTIEADTGVTLKSTSNYLLLDDSGTNEMVLNVDSGERMRVTSTGIDVTGTAVADAFTGPLTGNVTGNSDTATALATARTITIDGDVTATATSFDGSANITLTTAQANNSVDLGTHTTGSYVESLVAGTGVTLTNNSGEGATPTVSIGQAVENTSDVTFNDMTVSGDLTVLGSTTISSTSAHVYNAVTGTTPSLDVGSYNYFDNGILSGDTTVSFTSVPTNRNWRYSYKNGVAWDVSEGIYEQSFDISTEDSQPYGISFKPDGLKMYVLGNTDDEIHEYDLTTAWDISTASLLQSESISSGDTSPKGLFFKPDGTKLYISGDTGNEINTYNLSTAWDISTLSLSSSHSISAVTFNPKGLFFKSDGTKMYLVDSSSSNDRVIEWTLSTAWAPATKGSQQTFSVSTQTTSAVDIFFKSDGTKMYVTGDSTAVDMIFEYSLSTAWDISTASYTDSLNINANTSVAAGLFFKPDGSIVYLIRRVSDEEVTQYNIPTSKNLTLPSSVVGIPSATSDGDRVTLEFVTSDGGTTVDLIGESIISTV